MRDPYCTYESYPALLTFALRIGWTQNVVIMEAVLSMGFREWYLQAAKQFGWPKVELTENIADNVREIVTLESVDTLRQPKIMSNQKALCRIKNKHQATTGTVTWQCSFIKHLIRKYNRQWEHFAFSRNELLLCIFYGQVNEHPVHLQFRPLQST